MKKLTTKLLLSIIAFALTFIALGTQTFAWFAMNRTVTATGLEITVTSDYVFLIIGTGDNDTASEIQALNSDTVDLSASGSVLPCAHDSITNTTGATSTSISNIKQYELISDTTQKISIDAYNELESEDKALYQAENANGTNWYHQVADTVTSSNSTKAKHYLETLDTDYIIHQTCYITLAVGSEDAENLVVSKVNLVSNGTATASPSTFAPVKVLITTSTAAVELDSATTSSNTVIASTVTSSDVVQVDIFVYYNGNDTNVFTNNKAKLDGATISIEFSVD